LKLYANVKNVKKLFFATKKKNKRIPNKVIAEKIYPFVMGEGVEVSRDKESSKHGIVFLNRTIYLA
jgi:hypothetical protein